MDAAGGIDARFTLVERFGGDLNACAFNSHNRVAAACKDNTVRVYRIDTGARVATLYGHVAPVNTVVWARSGRVVASGGEDGMYVPPFTLSFHKHVWCL